MLTVPNSLTRTSAMLVVVEMVLREGDTGRMRGILVAGAGEAAMAGRRMED